MVRPTPASGFTGAAGPANAAEVARYVGMLEFDTSAVASDAQYIIMGTARMPVIGPWARVAPEIGSASLAESSLASGRIIGRITVRPGRADTEPSANLYIYVRQQGADWVASLLATDAGLLAGPNPMPLHPHSSTSTPGRVNARAVWIVHPVAMGIPIPPPTCISCRELLGWCGRDTRSFSDPRVWAYLNRVLRTIYPEPTL